MGRGEIKRVMEMKEIGRKIKEAREAKKVTIEALYKRTKINVDTIRAIEAGEADKLPQPYFRAFVRTIAKEVGLDPDELIREYDLRQKRLQDEQKKEIAKIKDEQSLHKLSRLRNRQKKLAFSIALILSFLVLIGLYVRYGKELFFEPKISEIPEAVNQSDSTHSNLTPVESKTEKSISRILKHSKNVHLGGGEIPLHSTVLDSGSSTDLHITRENTGEQSAKEKNPEQEQVKLLLPALVGHIEEKILLQKFPLYAKERDNYQPNSIILSRIEKLNPSLSIICFLGTWDPLSRHVVSRLLRILQVSYLPGVSLSLIGVDRKLKDKAGLSKFYHVQGIPSILFLSRGKEIGRIVGQPQEPIEAEFLQIVQKVSLFLGNNEKAKKDTIYKNDGDR